MKLTKRKGFNFFRSYFDVYNELNDDDKLAFIDALLNRQFLGVKPEGLKGMAKFAYISQTNSIDSQVKGFETKTGIILTPCEGARQGGCHTPTRQVEVEVEVEVEEKGKDIRFSFRKSLYDLGIEKPLVDDFLKNRKLKRLANTETAFNNLKIELNKNDIPLSILMQKIVSNGWGSFKNSWLEKEKSGAKKEKVSAATIIQQVKNGTYGQ